MTTVRTIRNVAFLVMVSCFFMSKGLGASPFAYQWEQACNWVMPVTWDGCVNVEMNSSDCGPGYCSSSFMADCTQYCNDNGYGRPEAMWPDGNSACFQDEESSAFICYCQHDPCAGGRGGL
jgi:hypothetical protein